MEYRLCNAIDDLLWPATNPDFNLKEHLSDSLECKVKAVIL